MQCVWAGARGQACPQPPPPLLLARGCPLRGGLPRPLLFFSPSLSLQLDTGKTFQAVMRFDTDVELTYFHNGGILNYMVRKMAK